MTSKQEQEELEREFVRAIVSNPNITHVYFYPKLMMIRDLIPWLEGLWEPLFIMKPMESPPQKITQATPNAVFSL
jgi:hypothetical protein